jgi:hypothetical protein
MGCLGSKNKRIFQFNFFCFYIKHKKLFKFGFSQYNIPYYNFSFFVNQCECGTALYAHFFMDQTRS